MAKGYAVAPGRITGGDTPVPLLDYVKALENRSNRERGDRVLAALRALGLEPVTQENRRLGVRNFVVDFSPGSASLLFTAHHDAVRGSPGANDNASGVAVLLGLCRELRGTSLPVRVVFFDREEAWLRTPFVRLGLLGSLCYVCTNGCGHLRAVFNLDFCGLGDFLGIWPVKKREEDNPAVRQVKAAAGRLGVPFGMGHLPWPVLSSDHLPFRFRGVPGAVTLSLFPADQVPAMEELVSRRSLRRLLLGRKVALPEPLSSVHTGEDTSSRLSEGSLQVMLSLVREIACSAVG